MMRIPVMLSKRFVYVLVSMFLSGCHFQQQDTRTQSLPPYLPWSCSVNWRCLADENISGDLVSDWTDKKRYEDREACAADLIRRVEASKKCPQDHYVTSAAFHPHYPELGDLVDSSRQGAGWECGVFWRCASDHSHTSYFLPSTWTMPSRHPDKASCSDTLVATIAGANLCPRQDYMFELFEYNDFTGTKAGPGGDSSTGTQGDPLVISSPQDGAAMKRAHLGYFSFSQWRSILQVDTGVKLIDQNGASRCEIFGPASSDLSTKFSPFQIYWVGFGEPSESFQGENKGMKIQDTFFDGDEVSAGHFRWQAVPGNSLHLPSETHLGSISFEGLSFSENNSVVTVFAPGKINSFLRVKAFPSGGTCQTEIYYCPKDGHCENDLGYTKFTSVHVVQGIFGTVSSAKFVE